MKLIGYFPLVLGDLTKTFPSVTINFDFLIILNHKAYRQTSSFANCIHNGGDQGV